MNAAFETAIPESASRYPKTPLLVIGLERETISSKWNFQKAAHRAVGTVASDDVPKSSRLGRIIRSEQFNFDASSVLLQRGQRNRPFDLDSELSEMFREYSLRLRLRDTQVTVGKVEKINGRVLSGGPIEIGTRADQPQSSVNERLNDAHVVPRFERPRRDSDRPAIRQRLCESIDDSAGSPMPREFSRHGQPDRASAYHKNVRHVFSPYGHVQLLRRVIILPLMFR